MLTNDGRPSAVGQAGAAPGKPSRPRGRGLDAAVIVMLSVVTLMIVALLVDMLFRLGLFRG